MKITDITTTHLHSPEGKPIQDATIPAPKEGSGGRGQIFVHIKTDEDIEGLGMTYSSPGVIDVIESSLKQELIMIVLRFSQALIMKLLTMKL